MTAVPWHACCRSSSGAGTAGRELSALSFSRAGKAYSVGFTGAPGSGKSTLTSALLARLKSRLAEPVAVLAVDPSSPVTGGAILGDRVRMQEHALDEAVFIRSMATRGHLGGLAAAVPEAVRLLDATGWPLVIVETVGVGQIEVEVAATCDTVVVVVNPGWGDSVQANKAGLLEVADVLVINKADRPGVQETARDLKVMLELSGQARVDPAHRRDRGLLRKGRDRALRSHRIAPRVPRRARRARETAIRTGEGRDLEDRAGSLRRPPSSRPLRAREQRASGRRSRASRSTRRRRPPAGPGVATGLSVGLGAPRVDGTLHHDEVTPVGPAREPGCDPVTTLGEEPLALLLAGERLDAHRGRSPVRRPAPPRRGGAATRRPGAGQPGTDDQPGEPRTVGVSSPCANPTISAGTRATMA